MGIRLLPLRGKAVALLDYLLSCLSIFFQDIITCGYRMNEEKNTIICYLVLSICYQIADPSTFISIWGYPILVDL